MVSLLMKSLINTDNPYDDDMMMMMMMMMMNGFVVWLTNEQRLVLFPAGTIIRDPHHRESPTRREQGLNLLRN